MTGLRNIGQYKARLPSVAVDGVSSSRVRKGPAVGESKVEVGTLTLERPLGRFGLRRAGVPLPCVLRTVSASNSPDSKRLQSPIPLRLPFLGF